MFIIIAVIINIVLSYSYNFNCKKNKEWLEKAATAYTEYKNTIFYPKSEIALQKKYYLYSALELRFIIGAWIITLILPFFVSEKIFLIIYIANYLYGNLLYSLSVLEQKIEVIKDEVYNENEYL